MADATAGMTEEEEIAYWKRELGWINPFSQYCSSCNCCLWSVEFVFIPFFLFHSAQIHTKSVSSRAKMHKSEEEVCVPETHTHALHLQLVSIHYDVPNTRLTVVLLSLR